MWKSSSLAVLFHGLAGDRDRAGNETVFRKQMETRAEGMRVRLVENEEGDLRLVEVRRGGAGATLRRQ